MERTRVAPQLEYDSGKLENSLWRVEENIVTIEERLEEEADLKTRREEGNEEGQRRMNAECKSEGSVSGVTFSDRDIGHVAQ